MKVQLGVQVLPHGQGLDLPTYQTEGAAGLDLRAAVPHDAPLRLPPGGRALVPTGLVVVIPPGFEGQVRPRSGNALRHGLGMINAPGTIDSDYRGELLVLLANFGQQEVVIDRGMRVAQLVIAPVARAELVMLDHLDATARGGQGFGSTGTG